jgi:integrase
LIDLQHISSSETTAGGALQPVAPTAFSYEPASLPFGLQQTLPLHFRAPDINVIPAIPVKRTGKAMSRRTGQDGHIERSGNWWVVRWWQDVPGQEKRRHMRSRICPISGPGKLSKSERAHRAREMVAESGADTLEYFNKVVRQEVAWTFREQAACWLESVGKRKRKPVAPSTLEDWERILENWLNPQVGDLPLSEINNGAMKKLVAAMSKGGLSAKTIETYSGVAKMVVASAVNSEGEQLYPRKWNHDFIDMPIVEQSKQNTPSFSAEVMTGLANWKKPRERMLFLLCGAGGLRIGEALGLEIDKHISPDFSTVSIRQKARHCKIETRLKTPSAERDVDLHPAIASLLKDYVGQRRSGFLFSSRKGKPLSSSNLIRRHLHPALKELGYINPHTGTHKAGNHAFRRFRNTYLRNKTQCPDGLRNYWMGHAGNSMDDLYDKIKEDVQFRKLWAEKSGFGFELPSVVPNVPKNAVKTELEKAA